MTKKQALQLFEQKKVRTIWDEEQEKWYFAIVDVVAVLTEQDDYLKSRKYWNKLKQRLKEEGNETVTNCHQFKLQAADGKMRLTDVADTEQLFRLIQSIPSPKAEPFKIWMSQVASTRLEQMQDPELSIEQAMLDYKRLGYSDSWINQRLKSIEIRKELTDEWNRTGVTENYQYATPNFQLQTSVPICGISGKYLSPTDFHRFAQIWLHVICVHLCHLWGIFLSHGFVFLAAANALGIGAASFWSVAEKDRAESPTASPERPKKFTIYS